MGKRWNKFKEVLGFDVGDPNLTETISSDTLLAALMGNGAALTRDQALKIPAVASDVDFLANIMAVIPIKLYQKSGDKVTTLDDNRVKLLNSDTGDTLDAFQMKKALTEDYLLGKGAYAFINRTGNTVTSLNYVEDERISIFKNTDPIFKEFQIVCNAQNYYPFQFLKILRNTKDGAQGVGLIDEVSKAFEIAYSTLLYQLYMVRNGGNKRGFLTSEKTLDENAIKSLKASWNDLYSTSDTNAVVLNKGIDFKEASNTSIEMQLNQSKITLSNEIDKVFHIENDFDMTFKKAILPLGTAFKTALNRDLLLEKEKNSGYFFDCDYNETTKASMQERFNAYMTAKNSGWMSRNEIRAKENLEKIEGFDTFDMSLGNIVFDPATGNYYVPNTGAYFNLQTGEYKNPSGITTEGGTNGQ